MTFVPVAQLEEHVAGLLNSSPFSNGNGFIIADSTKWFQYFIKQPKFFPFFGYFISILLDVLNTI